MAYGQHYSPVIYGPGGVAKVIAPGGLEHSTVYNSFTPAWTNLTAGNGVAKAFWWRSGSTMKGRVRFTFGSTSSISATPNMTIPNSESLNVTVVTSDITADFGYATLSEAGVQRINGKVMGASSTALALGYWSATNAQSAISATAPFTWGTGDIIDFHFEVPISGW